MRRKKGTWPKSHQMRGKDILKYSVNPKESEKGEKQEQSEQRENKE